MPGRTAATKPAGERPPSVGAGPPAGIAGAPSSVMTARGAAAVHTRGYIRAQLDGRRWQRPARGVLVTHNGPLTSEEALWVSLLASPAGSALGGLTAATLDGLTGFEPTTLDILIPARARRPVGAPDQHDSRDGSDDEARAVAGDDADSPVQYRRSRLLGDADVHPLRAPRRTRIARSIVDAAAWSSADRRARVLVLAAVQQRLVRPVDLRQVLERRQRFRHRPLALETIGDAEGGVQSLPELEFARLIRRHGLPEPTRQQVLRRSDGKYYLDTAWAEYDAACEVQGIPHLRVGKWEADMSRMNEILIAGPRQLAFSSYAIRHDQARVASQLTRLLRRGGWPG